jgi:DNA invertase Pin-like site-specific DNA recombinase
MVKTVAYLRVSTADQNTEKNKGEILFFANEKKFGNVSFVEETISGKKSWKDREIKNYRRAG